MLRRDGVVGGVGDCGLLAGDPQPPLIVRWWRRLWAKLDAGQVGPLQFAVHFAVGLAGVVGLINSGHTPQDVEDALGGSANAMWLWLCIGGWLSLSESCCAAKEDTSDTGCRWPVTRL